jgi:transposase-like protein
VVTSAVRMPKAGTDYPATFGQFQAWFATDEACAAYLAKLRWPAGFECPSCGGRDAWQTAGGLWLCQGCRRKTSVTAGTIFHRSRLPLRSWFAVAWFVTSQKNGASALGLQKIMGFGSYQTAWAWLHKLRRAMVRPERERLSGIVEVDETYVGGRERGVDGRLTTSKTVVAMAVEVLEPKGLGRVRMMRMPELTQRGLLEFVRRSVVEGSTVRTDGWNVYKPLADTYVHEALTIAGSGDPAHVALPGVHRVAALVKRWIAGTLHHGISHEHLDYYLDEFTFRFNRRTSRARGLLFHRLLEQAVATEPVPYQQLIARSLDPYIWG